MTILVAGKKWTIKRRHIQKRQGDWGYAECDKREIVIDSSLKGMPFINTLIHEIVHAADKETEEQRAEVMASAVMQALAKLGLLTTED